ncbi:MAG: acetate/propionate family kinase [Bacteroidota bacterium]
MHILVINSGSSSVKAALVDADSGQHSLWMTVKGLPEAPSLTFSDGTSEKLKTKGHEAAMEYAMPLLKQKLNGQYPSGIGHRVVHGGNVYDRPVRIDNDVENQIDQLSPLAPLHNPLNLLGIQLMKRHFPELDQVAVFDTAFHQSVPSRAKLYALPKEVSEKYGLRKFGFHGTSHEYVGKKAAEFLSADWRELRLITCHLGSGASITAIEYGRSVETSMGMTPLEGLMMGTRSGDIDPGLLIYLQEEAGYTAVELDEILNRQSGLAGVSGLGNDMRAILQKSTEGDRDCQLAVQMFTHRLRKYIGAYAAVMGGVDAIVFTGGIGENSAVVRHWSCQRLDYLGALIDEDVNLAIKLSADQPVVEFSRSHSRVKLLAIHTDEQLAIARHTAQLLRKADAVNTKPAIPIAISARHIHLRQETLDQLFGKNYELTVRKWLSQPGQFAAEETVTIVGPRNRIEGVRILGPVRSVDQVEVSRTDEFFLGVDAPIRESGKVENSPGIHLIGPAGELTLKQGLICAWRHIHMTPEDAVQFGVKDRDIVEVAVENGDRGLTFGNVLVRVSEKYVLEMHIDTDEGNAAEIYPGDEGVLEDTGSSGVLKKRRTD